MGSTARRAPRVHPDRVRRGHAGAVVRRRFALLYAVVLALGLAAAAAVVVARPTVEEAIAKIPGAAPPTTTTTLPPVPPVKEATRLATLDVRVSGVELVRVGPGPAELPREVRDGVVGAVTSYVQRATLDPMATGGEAADVGEVFTRRAAERLSTGDRATLVDEGLPPSRPVGRPAADLRLVALAGAGGGVELVTVTLLVDVQAMTADGRAVLVNRVGELTLASDGRRWLVDSYAMSVERQVEQAT